MPTRVNSVHRKILAGALLFSATVFAPLSLAHHGWSGYDKSKPTTLTGTIRELRWANPHGTIRLEVVNSVDAAVGKSIPEAKAHTKVWTGTLAPVSRMESRGLKQEALKTGTTVTIVGLPSKTQEDEVKVEQITVNGKTFELRQ